MSEILFEIVFVLGLVLANGLFAMSEMSIISSRRARLEQRAADGDAGALTALELAGSPNRFLSTVQIGITLIGILAGAVGGAGLAEFLARQLALVPALEPYSATIGLVLVVSGIGYLSLVLGELAPKRIALGNPERIASLVARPMRLLSKIAAPVVRLLSLSTDVVIRLAGAKESKEPPVTEQEIRILIRQGTESGVFEPIEQDMVESVFHLGDRSVASLMTPRPDVVFLRVGDTADRVQEVLAEHHFSRYPLREMDSDEMLGIVRAKDILLEVLRGETLDLTSIARPALVVPETTSAMKTLEQMKGARVHSALVVDEFGVTVGMVTYHDVLEAIVGDLPSADRPKDSQAVRREDGSWLLDGALSVDELVALLDLGAKAGEVRGPYHTLGGFVAARLGALPKVADRFRWNDFVFEVVDMDANRVDKVLVTPAAPGGGPPATH